MSEWSRDILLSIFQHLDCQSFFRARQTCKQWNAWIKEEIERNSPWLEQVSIRMLKENDKQCQELVFSEREKWSEQRIDVETNYYTSVSSVYHRYVYVKDAENAHETSVCGKCKEPMYHRRPKLWMDCRNAFCYLESSMKSLQREKRHAYLSEKKRRKIK